jgi:hypothetical protein
MTIQYCMEITGEYYDDYDEACEAALKYYQYSDTLREVLSEIPTADILEGLHNPTKGEELFEAITIEAESRFLSMWIVEVESEEDEENA